MPPTRLGVVTCASILSLALSACGDSKPSPEEDAGTSADAGPPPDAGTTPDDAGTRTDAGTPPDAGTEPARDCTSVLSGTGGAARWQGLGLSSNAGTIYSRTDATADSSDNVFLVQHRQRPRPSNDDADILLTKRSPDGQALWQKSYGSILGDSATDLRVDGTGHVFLAGVFGYNAGSIHSAYGIIDLGTGPIQTVATNEDGFVVKVAPDGSTVWATPITSVEESSVGQLALLPSGNVLVAGGVKSRSEVKVGEAALPPLGVYTNRVFVAELEGATGRLVWGRGLPGFSNRPDYLPRIATGPGGEVFITANDDGKTLVLALGADAARTERWTRSLTGLWDVRIATHPDGGLYLVGLFEGTIDVGTGPLTAAADDAAFLVARLDAEGRTVSARILTGADDISGEIDDIEVDAAGRLLLLGEWPTGPIDSAQGPLAVAGEFAVLVDRDLSPVWVRGFRCTSASGAGRRGDGVLVSGTLDIVSVPADLGAGPIPGDGAAPSFAVQYGP